MKTLLPRSMTTTLGAAGALALLLGMGLGGCSRVQPSRKGERCAADQPCAKGLRCSFKKKRCYLPVQCDRLAKRLEACTRELLETWSPKAKTLPSTKRVKLISQIREHLKTEVVDHCRFDAAAYKRKHGTKPPRTKSWGEDRDASTLNGCLAKGACTDFARCFLEAAKLMGKGRAGLRQPGVFPLAVPRPAPDAGTPAPTPAGSGDGPTPATDGARPTPATDRARPAPATDRARPTPATDMARPTPATDMARPAAPAPRPR